MTPDEKAQAYADNISKDYPFNFSEELQIRLIKNDFLAGYNAAQEAHEEYHAKQLQELKDKLDCDKYHLEENHKIEMNEVRNKCFADINEFTAKWEASDRKMDALHLKEVKRLKDYIESILFEIERVDHLCEVKRFVELNKPL